LPREQNKTKKLTEEAKEVLLEYHWPGNVRELKNLMERLSIIVEKDTIDADSLEIKIKTKSLRILKAQNKSLKSSLY
jgi:Transcriptional regulator containing PAS, AAA-type ATPase, and DNA-binding domains